MAKPTTTTTTIKPEDVGVLNVSPDGVLSVNTDEAVDPASAVYIPPQTLDMSDLRKGMVVVFVDQTLNTHPSCNVSTPQETNAQELSGKVAMVVAIEPGKPGKQVAVCFKDKIKGGHSCDGRVPDGFGAYVLANHLYTAEAFAAHKTASDHVQAEQKQIDDMLKGFVAQVAPTP